jgi:hypothetical protein
MRGSIVIATLTAPTFFDVSAAVPIGFLTPFAVAVAVIAPMPFDVTTKLNAPLRLASAAALSTTGFVPCASAGASVHVCVTEGWRR